MTDIDVTGIVLLPSDAWTERLLGASALGSLPPLAWRCGRSGWCDSRSAAVDANLGVGGPLVTPYPGLALAWEGRQTEGLARALRCLAEHEKVPTEAGLTWEGHTEESDAGHLIHSWTLGSGRRLYTGISEGCQIIQVHSVTYWTSSDYVGRSSLPFTVEPNQAVVALASPPIGLGLLFDLWALATVEASKGIAARVELIHGS